MPSRRKPGEPDTTKGPYSIVIPPPNVTGALHLGHALNNTLQDILIRMRRMQGYNTLWMPGTDHAGIATQAVVEKRLREEEGMTRHDLGREELVERIWEWKDVYEKRILGQLRQMGCSCDWERTRFTLDEGCSRAVRQTFFRPVQQGPDLPRQAAGELGHVPANRRQRRRGLSGDGEGQVLALQVSGHAVGQAAEPARRADARRNRHHPPRNDARRHRRGRASRSGRGARQGRSELRERLDKAPAKEKDGIQAQIDNIAKRRTEMLPLLVKLRDMARAGRKVMLPLVNREIPLIGDEWAKPELGTGAVKITPAHDPNDYEVGKRQSLPMINILNPDGTLNENAGAVRGPDDSQGPRRASWPTSRSSASSATSKTARSSCRTATAARRRSSRTWRISGS